MKRWIPAASLFMGLFLFMSCGNASLEVPLSESANVTEADTDNMVSGNVFSPIVSVLAVHAIRSDENDSVVEINGVKHKVHFIEGAQGETGRTIVLENMETGETRALRTVSPHRVEVRQSMSR